MSSVAPSRRDLDFELSATDIRDLLDSTEPFDVNRVGKKAWRWKDYVNSFGSSFMQFFLLITEAPELKKASITNGGITRDIVLQLYNTCVSQLTSTQRAYLNCTTTLPDHSTVGGYVFGRVLLLHNIVYYMLQLLPATTAITATTSTTATAPATATATSTATTTATHSTTQHTAMSSVVPNIKNC
jgi:hypothetical protein